MIATLEGVLAARGENEIVIEVGGVGFLLSVPSSVLRTLPAPGETVRLYTHLVMKEDGVTLYGFKSMKEKRLFLQLISVSRVGPRLGLSVLSGLAPDKLCSVIAAGDVPTLSLVPGLGKKTAERIIVDLKDKVELSFGKEAESGYALEMEAGGKLADEAAAALKVLGYSALESRQALQYAHRELGDGATLEALIQAALKYFLR